MTTYIALNLPDAWKPLLKTLADEGWELAEMVAPPEDCRMAMRMERDGLTCCLSFWDEAEWCGNQYGRRALTVAALSVEVPARLLAAEPHTLLLTGDWQWQLPEFVAHFFQPGWAKNDGKTLDASG